MVGGQMSRFDMGRKIRVTKTYEVRVDFSDWANFDLETYEGARKEYTETHNGEELPWPPVTEEQVLEYDRWDHEQNESSMEDMSYELTSTKFEVVDEWAS